MPEPPSEGAASSRPSPLSIAALPFPARKKERPCCIGPLVEIARQDRHLMPELGETNGPFQPTSNSGPLAGSHANAERRIFSAASRSCETQRRAQNQRAAAEPKRKRFSFLIDARIMTRTDGGPERSPWGSGPAHSR